MELIPKFLRPERFLLSLGGEVGHTLKAAGIPFKKNNLLNPIHGWKEQHAELWDNAVRDVRSFPQKIAPVPEPMKTSSQPSGYTQSAGLDILNGKYESFFKARK